jgi:hypothetical protein
MTNHSRAALVRFFRGLAFAVLATGASFGLDEVPELGDVVPQSSISIPILMAALLGVDKWVRAKREAAA